MQQRVQELSPSYAVTGVGLDHVPRETTSRAMNWVKITPGKAQVETSTSASCRPGRVLGRKRNELVSHAARQEQLQPSFLRRPARRSGYRAEESVPLRRDPANACENRARTQWEFSETLALSAENAGGKWIMPVRTYPSFARQDPAVGAPFRIFPLKILRKPGTFDAGTGLRTCFQLWVSGVSL